MKIIILILTAVLLSSSSFSGTLEDFFNNVSTSVSKPVAKDVQGRGYYIGGGFTIRTPRAVINPVKITTPSLKVGCSGIDITFGAFDFIDDLSDVVDFLNQALISSVGIMLGGLSAVCPVCSSIVTKIQTIANQLNQMQLDSCELGYKIAENGGKMFVSATKELLSDGTYSSYAKALKDMLTRADRFLDKWTEAMRKSGCNPNDDDCILSLFKVDASGNPIYKSLLDKVLRKTSLKDDVKARYVIRGITGDLYIKKSVDTKDFPFSLKYVPPIYEGKHKEYFLRMLLFGNQSTVCEPTAVVKLEGLNDTGSEQPITLSINPLCKKVQETLENIVNKLQTRTALDPVELNFLSQFKIPVYKLLNVFSIEPYMINAIIPELVSIMTAEKAYLSLQVLTSEILRAINLFSSSDYQNNILALHLDNLQKIREDAVELVQEAYSLYVETAQDWRNQIQSFEDYEEIESRIYARMIQNPIMGAYIFSKGLSY